MTYGGLVTGRNLDIAIDELVIAGNDKRALSAAVSLASHLKWGGAVFMTEGECYDWMYQHYPETYQRIADEAVQKAAEIFKETSLLLYQRD